MLQISLLYRQQSRSSGEPTRQDPTPERLLSSLLFKSPPWERVEAASLIMRGHALPLA